VTFGPVECEDITLILKRLASSDGSDMVTFRASEDHVFPELRTGLEKSHADLHSTFDAALDVDDAALAFCFVLCICDPEALAVNDFCLQRNQAAAFVQVERVGFFVERLAIEVGAVDEYRHIEQDAFGGAMVAWLRVFLLVDHARPEW
jgi:hypothetical protein